MDINIDKKSIVIILLFVFLLYINCVKNPKTPFLELDSRQASLAFNDSGMSTNNTLKVQAKNPKKTKQKIENIITEKKYFLERQNIDKLGYDTIYYIRFRVPYKDYKDTIALIKNEGLVANENVSEINLSDNLSEANKRLEILVARKEKLLGLLEDKNIKISDIITLNKELQSLENESNYVQKNIAGIKRDLEYPLISLTIEPKFGTHFQSNMWSFNNSLNKAIGHLIKVVFLIIDIAIEVIIFSPILSCCYIIYKILQKYNFE